MISDWEYENHRLRQIVKQQDEVLAKVRRFAEGLATVESMQYLAEDLFSILNTD